MKRTKWFASIILLLLITISINAQEISIKSQYQLSSLNLENISLSNLETYKKALAKDIAYQLNDKNFQELVISRITSESITVPLGSLLKDYQEIWPNAKGKELYQEVTKLDLKIREAKGIQFRLNELLELRLASTKMLSALKRGVNPLVAFVPTGNESKWQYIEAFDLSGNIVHLDPQVMPNFPVFVVGLNGKKDLKAGLELMNDELSAAGLQPSSTNAIQPLTSVETSKLTKISMVDDKEPWILGAAEMYVLVAGVDPNLDKASIKAVDLPYLDYDNTIYYPNQIIIYWSNYRYAACDLLFYEHDDNTNYQEIASGLISAIGVLAPQYSSITDVASKIINLIPNSLFSNDDDYADVFYTLERGKTYTDKFGVSSNVKLSIVPYTLTQ